VPVHPVAAPGDAEALAGELAGLLDVLVVPAAASRAKLARALAMDRRLPEDLPRLRGPAATVVAVIPAAWRVLAPD